MGSPHHAASLPQGTVLRIGAPPNLHLCRNQVQLSVCSRICSALRPRSDPQCKPAVLDALSPVARACVLHGDPSARRFSVVQGQWLRHASNWLHREGNPPLLSPPCPSPLPELPGWGGKSFPPSENIKGASSLRNAAGRGWDQAEAEMKCCLRSQQMRAQPPAWDPRTVDPARAAGWGCGQFLSQGLWWQGDLL